MSMRTYGIVAGGMMLAACAQIPNGPSVAVMPPPGKPFDLFVQDEQLCRNYASQAIGGTSAQQAQAASVIGSAAVGTALGAAVGAIAGGGRGAGTGAAIGAAGGTVVGLGEGDYAGRATQRRYDIAYEQCMYARGNILPGQSSRAYQAPPPPPSQYGNAPYGYPAPPPPPSGNAPYGYPPPPAPPAPGE